MDFNASSSVCLWNDDERDIKDRAPITGMKEEEPFDLGKMLKEMHQENMESLYVKDDSFVGLGFDYDFDDDYEEAIDCEGSGIVVIHSEAESVDSVDPSFYDRDYCTRTSRQSSQSSIKSEEEWVAYYLNNHICVSDVSSDEGHSPKSDAQPTGKFFYI